MISQTIINTLSMFLTVNSKKLFDALSMTVLSLRTSSTMTRLFQVRRKQWPEMSSPDQWCPDLKHCCLDKILLTQHTPVRSCNNGNKKTAKKYQTRVANNKRHQVEEFSFDRTFPWNTNFKINARQNKIKFCNYVFIFKNITLEYLIRIFEYLKHHHQ